jgi:hypothetical protein
LKNAGSTVRSELVEMKTTLSNLLRSVVTDDDEENFSSE